MDEITKKKTNLFENHISKLKRWKKRCTRVILGRRMIQNHPFLKPKEENALEMIASASTMLWGRNKPKLQQE
jgi:hypothetical protein